MVYTTKTKNRYVPLDISVPRFYIENLPFEVLERIIRVAPDTKKGTNYEKNLSTDVCVIDLLRICIING